MNENHEEQIVAEIHPYRVIARLRSTMRDMRMGYWIQVGPPVMREWTDLRGPYQSQSQAQSAMAKRAREYDQLIRWNNAACGTFDIDVGRKGGVA